MKNTLEKLIPKRYKDKIYFDIIFSCLRNTVVLIFLTTLKIKSTRVRNATSRSPIYVCCIDCKDNLCIETSVRTSQLSIDEFQNHVL